MTELKQKLVVEILIRSAVGAPAILAGRSSPVGSGVIAACGILAYSSSNLVFVPPNVAKTEHHFDLSIPLAARTSPDNGE